MADERPAQSAFTPLVARVRAELERMIMSGELTGGDRINENLLAERFGVSRGPIREACRALTQEGLLVAIPNRGAFVREIALKDALEVYDVRAALDDLMGRTLAERINEAQLAELQRLIEQMDAAAANDDIDRYYPVNLAFHDCLLRFAGNQRLARLYDTLIKELHLFRRKGLLEEGSMRISNEEHRRVLGALAKRDPVRAGIAMRGHVLAAKQRLIAAIETRTTLETEAQAEGAQRSKRRVAAKTAAG
jgi:DNA-binding GntR family transcriptional regulator